MLTFITLLFWLFAVIIPGTPQNLKDNKGLMPILFYGNSLTAGYGIDSDNAYTHLIQLKIWTDALKRVASRESEWGSSIRKRV